jgi:hypothetical protein
VCYNLFEEHAAHDPVAAIHPPASPAADYAVFYARRPMSKANVDRAGETGNFENLAGLGG